jgi:adenosylcobinamide-GDP ribazoletransferase
VVCRAAQLSYNRRRKTTENHAARKTVRSMSSALDPISWWTDLKLGLSVLTRLPVRAGIGEDGEAAGRSLAQASRVMPLVGVVVGLAGTLAFWLAGLLGLPALAAGLIAVGATILLTGAFHEDGLADVADGFGGAFARDRKLEIMRDSRIGTYGVLALVLSLGLRAAALAAIGPGWLAGAALIAAHAAARCALPVVMATTPLARDDGLAAGAGRPGRADVWTALGLAAAIAVVVLGPGLGLLALVACAAATAAMVLLARAQIGGYTGDVLGATEQMGETAVLLAIAAAL